MIQTYPSDSTISWRSPRVPTERWHSKRISSQSHLSSIIVQLRSEIFDALTWNKITPQVSPAAFQASSTFWLDAASPINVEWEERFLAPFRPNRTVKVTMRMRYVGPLQPEHLSLEDDWLD